MRGDGIFVLVMDLNSEEFLNLLGRPHLNGIPGHPGSELDTIDRAKADARFAPRAIIRNDYRKFLRLLFLTRDLGRGFGNNQGWICLFWIVCHSSV